MVKKLDPDAKEPDETEADSAETATAEEEGEEETSNENLLDIVSSRKQSLIFFLVTFERLLTPDFIFCIICYSKLRYEREEKELAVQRADSLQLQLRRVSNDKEFLQRRVNELQEEAQRVWICHFCLLPLKSGLVGI